jgi:hypothetical protein
MRVIATAPGYDNLTVRQPGEEFDMPDSVLAKREIKNSEGKVIGVYDPPSWFKKVESKKVQAQEADKDPV